MEIIIQHVQKFLVIFLRVSTFFVLLPFFGSRNLPAQFKIGLIVALTLVLTPVVEIPYLQTSISSLVIKEVMLGIVLGLTARLIFFAVETAGQIMAGVMGLSIASSFNPEMGQSTELARIYGMLAMLVFLSVDAHHDLIYIFVKSFEWIPSGQIQINNLIPQIISEGSKMFVIALKLSAPVVIIILITNLLMGFLSKAAPQMNIFFIGYPLFIFVGFLVIFMSIPLLVNVLGNHMGNIKNDMQEIISIGRS